MRSDTGQVFRLEDYRATDYLIPRVALTFRLDPDRTSVTAVLDIERRDGVAQNAPLVLDGDGLRLTSLEIDGVQSGIDHEVTPERLTIRDLPPAKAFRIRIETEISPRSNTALMGLYLSNGVYCTQCEAEGFRRITYFLDRPDVLSVYSVRVEGDRRSAPLLLSNGNRGDSGNLPDGRHFAVWDDPFPKPCYLFALVAGDLGCVSDRFTTASGREVSLGVYVEHGKEARAAYAMDALKRSMRWDEEVFGREYDLDIFNIVAVSDFNMGAMENKGLNVFNDKYVLADPETATDADYANIEAIIAHEYFHNWTGNRITCRDWFQLCLKEGLTVYRDHEFSADERSRAVKRIAEVRTLKSHQFPEDQGPLAHPVRPRRYREINNFYTSTVYEKGSEVVRMIRTILGHAKFRAGMDLYFERHDGEAATIEDFIRVFEDVSGRDLTQFALWYHQAGTPNLLVRASHDTGAAEFTLEIEQSTAPTPGEARKRLMHIPLAFGLVGPDGADMRWSGVEGATVEGGVIHVRKRKHVIRFSGIAQRPVVSVNRGFSAPVTLTLPDNQENLLFLAGHDVDLFARWQALTTLLTEALIAATAAIRSGQPAQFADDLLHLIGDFACDGKLEPAFRALAITLPSESDIAREAGSNVDPDAILVARDDLLKAIHGANADRFHKLYLDLADDGAFSPDAGSAGRRALRNVLLDILTCGAGDPSLASAQYRSATNMTDLAAALAVLTQRQANSAPARDALAAFETRFGDNHLVMDKWFQIQASAPGRDASRRVRTLMTHPAFSIDNPNRVRSLIGTFAAANQTGFNAADGSGYALFADVVLQVDGRNGQLSARLATSLRSWRSLEPARRELARASLAEMAARPDLSTDLRDIVDRTLA